MKKTFLISFLILIVCHTLLAQDKNNSGNLASCVEFSNTFNDIKTICDKDNVELWGVNLYAPILCINNNRDLWSNQKDLQGQLQTCGEVFIGKYPLDKNIANSTVDVYGQKWVMLRLPLPADTIDRNILFCHEMFHYWQDSLGLVPDKGYNNVHMDAKDARVLLKLEWKAFLTACRVTDSSLRKMTIRDGLTFRKCRQQKYSQYYQDETAFEVHEGLAQYTGIKLSVSSDSMYIHILDKEAESYMNKENLVRSYAYFSGAVMGYLLDKSACEWREQVDENSDLGFLLQKAYNILLPEDSDGHVRQRRSFYDYDSIMEFESRRDSMQAKKKGELVNLFTQNIKKLPLRNMQISFDPNFVINLQGIGNVYKNARIIDDWGILETKDEGSVLITEDWRAVVLPYANSIETNNNVKETESWKLQLKVSNK